MNKTLIAVLLAAALAASVAPMAGCGRTPDGDVQLIEGPAPEDVRLLCTNCREEFAQSEGRPMPARQDMVVCPHCGKPTTIRSRAGDGT